MIAIRLKEIRTKQFLTQELLAFQSGISRETIAHLELGRSARASTIRALAEALSVEPAELVQGEQS